MSASTSFPFFHTAAAVIIHLVLVYDVNKLPRRRLLAVISLFPLLNSPSNLFMKSLTSTMRKDGSGTKKDETEVVKKFPSSSLCSIEEKKTAAAQVGVE
jgi:hypothetical protein